MTIIAVLTAILLATGFLLDSGDDAVEPGPGVAPVEAIAKRVEAIRGLKFDALPEPAPVSKDAARKAGLADLDRSYPAARRAADETVYRMLELVPKDFDLRKAVGSIFGEGVAGYYDPHTGELRIVEGASSGRVLAEYILAHELNHALEDQVFELDTDRAEGTGDAALAYLGLIEGTASAVMDRYLERHFRNEEAIFGVLGSAFQPQPDLPPFILDGLLFPYLRGAQFVEELYADAGYRWTLVDQALRHRPPESTEHILHPRRYLRFEKPVVVGASRALAECCRRRAAGVFGEFQTAELLALAGRRQPENAAGWGGDRYELARRPDGTDVLWIRWVWDTDEDREEFADALRDWAHNGLVAAPAGRDRWRRETGGGVAIAETDADVTLVLDTTADRAAAIASVR